MRLRSLFLALCAAVAAALAGPNVAAALTPDQTAAVLARQMRQAGGASGAVVVDLATNTQLYAARSGTARLPASVEKLYTTSAALLRMGETRRLRSEVRAVEILGLDGTLDGDLYLRGGGDPTLTSAGLRSLARALVRRTGLSRVTGRVIGDDSAFDRRRGVPSAGYRVSADVEPLGALIVDRGRTGLPSPYYQADPPSFAASVFAEALRAEGVKVARRGRSGTAPPGALTLAARRSPPLRTLVRLSNVPSDNFIAEMLLKAVGASASAQGTTARGAAVVEATIGEELGVTPEVVDGSGLSRADSTSPREVVQLLAGMRARREGPALFDSLAVAGRSGTLRDRLRRSVARDRCRAKTGTLRDVSNLAGYCTTTSGTMVAFAILMNAVNPYAARRLQDRMVSAIARYAPGP